MESKNPENPDDSAIGSDPDSQHSLQDIGNILQKLQIDVTSIRSDLRALFDQVDSNSTDNNDLKHKASALQEDISKVRGFNRELLNVTFDFKKVVYEYIYDFTNIFIFNFIS